MNYTYYNNLKSINITDLSNEIEHLLYHNVSIDQAISIAFCALTLKKYENLKCDSFNEFKKNYHLSGDNKSDKMDAYNLCDRLRSGVLKRVWHGGDRVESLRQLAHSYQELTKDSTRLKLRLKALFRSRGIQVSDELYDSKMLGELIAKLPIAEQRTRALHLADLLERVTQRREQAYKDMVRLASRDKMYQAVISIPQFGEVFTSLFIATVCTPHRFRTRGQFCSYAGFAVSTYESSEYELDPRGRACKKSRKVRTRGLTKSFNRTLKYIFNSSTFSSTVITIIFGLIVLVFRDCKGKEIPYRYLLHSCFLCKPLYFRLQR